MIALSAPAYDLLVALHALCSLVGFGAVAVSGLFANRARRSEKPLFDERLRRYFRPATNWPARCLLLTPFLGAAAWAAGDRSASSEAWPWVGLACWTVAAIVATSLCWPAERQLQGLFVAGADKGEPEGFRSACARLEGSAAAISLLFVAAVVVMVWQPS